LSVTVELIAGNARCLILPGAGGSLGGWWLDGTPLLRPAPPQAGADSDPTRLAGFALVPYSNRIGAGQFTWAGEAHQLPVNQAGEPHSLHGLGWQRPWRLAGHSRACASLVLEHAGGADWPWPFVAQQEIALAPDRLTLALSARNLADRAVPLAIGHHPYFARAGAWLELAAARVWLPGADQLPARAVAPTGALDLSAPADAAGHALDHCYEAVKWPAYVGWADRDYRLCITASPNLPCAVVYSSAANDALCIEPVPHVSNALGRGATFPVVQPGDTFCCTITLAVEAAP
jgi:aldose 1-epimerase